MRNLLIMALLLAYSSSAKSQVTYSNYIDYTSEWNYYIEGWGEKRYYTYYINGDSLINGQWYYKRYVTVLDSNFNVFLPGALPTATITNYTTPYLIREDSSKHYYSYNTSTSQEEMIDDFDLSIGSPISLSDTGCHVYYIDTVYLGTRALQHFKSQYPPSNNNPPRGTVEGVGYIGLGCSASIESFSCYACYKKQNDALSFYPSVPCSAFLSRQTVSVRTESKAQKIKVYPNPVSDNLIRLEVDSDIQITQINIYDLNGRLLWFSNYKSSLDISSLEPGMYILELKHNTGVFNSIFVKQ